MTRSRYRDPLTKDLFEWQPPKVAVGYGAEVTGRGRLDNRIARLISQALRDARDDGRSRSTVAKDMTSYLGRTIPAHLEPVLSGRAGGFCRPDRVRNDTGPVSSSRAVRCSDSAGNLARVDLPPFPVRVGGADGCVDRPVNAAVPGAYDDHRLCPVDLSWHDVGGSGSWCGARRRDRDGADRQVSGTGRRADHRIPSGADIHDRSRDTCDRASSATPRRAASGRLIGIPVHPWILVARPHRVVRSVPDCLK